VAVGHLIKGGNLGDLFLVVGRAQDATTEASLAIKGALALRFVVALLGIHALFWLRDVEEQLALLGVVIRVALVRELQSFAVVLHVVYYRALAFVALAHFVHEREGEARLAIEAVVFVLVKGWAFRVLPLPGNDVVL